MSMYRKNALRHRRGGGMASGLLGIWTALWLTACATPMALSPTPPPTATEILPNARWQAALPHDGQPLALLQWWQTFHDPLLDILLARAEQDSPTLAEAVARIAEARSQQATVEAGFWPLLGLEVHGTRNNGSADFPLKAQTTTGTALDARWELDLFGQTQHQDTAATAALAGSTQLWHAARISLAAEVASRYVRYRMCQQTLSLLEVEQASYDLATQITSQATREGWLAVVDLQQMQTLAAQAGSLQAQQQAACAAVRKSLVTLTGLAEEDLQKRLDAVPAAGLPRPAAFQVATLPVALLSQRPDLAAAESALAAARAGVSGAVADHYPRLSLVGSLRRDRSRADESPALISSPWFFGPSLTLPLLQGGALNARQAAAQARYEQVLARYRQAVRLAVEEAETALLQLESARQRRVRAQTAAQAQAAIRQAAEQQWQAGGLSRLALEEVRRHAALTARQELLAQGDEVLAWIALYKALGGGWTTETAKAAPPSAATPVPAPLPPPSSPMLASPPDSTGNLP